jgi:hypothetical protein
MSRDYTTVNLSGGKAGGRQEWLTHKVTGIILLVLPAVSPQCCFNNFQVGTARALLIASGAGKKHAAMKTNFGSAR